MQKVLRIGSVQHKIHIGTHNSETTNWKIQIGQFQFGGYKLEHTIREIQIGKYKTGNTHGKMLLGKYNSYIQIKKYESVEIGNTIRKQTKDRYNS